MVSLDQIREPVTADFLVGFTDIRGFLRIAKSLGDSRRIFDFMSGFADVSAAVLDGSSGRVVKFIGDATLVLFPGEDADAGVRAMLEAKRRVDAYLGEHGFDSQLTVSLHYGEATVGPFGPEKHLDVLGDSVNVAAMAERNNRQSAFVITPQAFRRLAPETRKLFRKHTPPIAYVTR